MSPSAGPAAKVKSTASSGGGREIGYPQGHLGHLSADEERALTNFKLLLQEKSLYKPGPPASLDDQSLLRFLRARRWVVQDAYQQFQETEVWRTANHLDVLYRTIDVDVFDDSRKLYPQWTGRRDRRGLPLYLFEIRHLEPKTVAAYEKTANKAISRAPTDGKTPNQLLRLFALYESMIHFLLPLCSTLSDRDHASTPITQGTNIVDVNGVSLRQFWNLKSHMQSASQLATAHYPETLDRIFVIGAPSYFSTVWGWIQRWFDPITVSKVFILNPNEVKPTLERFIDPVNIPKQYGGQMDFTWGEMPNLDPAIRNLATWEGGHTTFPKGPILWKEVDGGSKLEAIAVGTLKGNERSEKVCTIPRNHKLESSIVPAGETTSASLPDTQAGPAAPTDGPVVVRADMPAEAGQAPIPQHATSDDAQAQAQPNIAPGLEHLDAAGISAAKTSRTVVDEDAVAGINGVRDLAIEDDIPSSDRGVHRLEAAS